MKRVAFVFVAIFSVFSQTCADDVSLPLGGYFHPGRAMPVKWNVTAPESPDATVQISASDAITTYISSNNPHGIAPWIAIDPNAGNLHWRSSSGAAGEISGLHPLDESDFLVGTTDAGDPHLSALFPNRRLIPIHLDPEDLQSPAMAWETLDAILLTSDEWQKLPTTLRRGLFAEGITLAVAGGPQPDALFLWHRSDQSWIASPELKVPPIIDADVYSPTDGWPAGRSTAFRRRILLFGAIYCLIACGTCLWRSRWTAAAFVAMTIIAAAAFALDNAYQSPIFHRSGTVLLYDQLPYQDIWLYQVSHQPADFHLPVEGFVHPVFEDASQPDLMKLKLECDANGNPIAISGHLPPDEPLALMSRQLAADNREDSAIPPATSPLLRLAKSIYPQFQIAGELPNSTQEQIWPTIVLTRR